LLLQINRFTGDSEFFLFKFINNDVRGGFFVIEGNYQCITILVSVFFDSANIFQNMTYPGF